MIASKPYLLSSVSPWLLSALFSSSDHFNLRWTPHRTDVSIYFKNYHLVAFVYLYQSLVSLAVFFLSTFSTIFLLNYTAQHSRYLWAFEGIQQSVQSKLLPSFRVGSYPINADNTCFMTWCQKTISVLKISLTENDREVDTSPHEEDRFSITNWGSSYSNSLSHK